MQAQDGRRRRLAATVVAGTLAVGAVAAGALPDDAGAGKRAAKARTVTLGTSSFSPRTLTVRRGDKVVWKWRGGPRHDVVVRKGPQKFRSRLQSSGRYTRTLRKAGTYQLACTQHATMRMKLVVRR